MILNNTYDMMLYDRYGIIGIDITSMEHDVQDYGSQAETSRGAAGTGEG